MTYRVDSIWLFAALGALGLSVSACASQPTPAVQNPVAPVVTTPLDDADEELADADIDEAAMPAKDEIKSDTPAAPADGAETDAETDADDDADEFDADDYASSEDDSDDSMLGDPDEMDPDEEVEESDD